MGNDRQIGRFLMRQAHFEQVREHLRTALDIAVTDDVLEAFLLANGPILGMIVGYDEVETEARYMIWNAADLYFDKRQLS
ncbi:hypothetical protein [Massilia sp. CCM 8734]|uniref:hypothetical protein n=1 Tax=Massilia sp. CCM 8734 TaxID=2609283 RepID=UPI00141DB0E0|nr:hypothetical protein [Massilia sp. CCM 8734]NHZ99093.1 hypothetical protein [Massilia sp. CCM 8734]